MTSYMDDKEALETLWRIHGETIDCMKRLGRPGITFTRWQRFKIWWYQLWRRRDSVQSIIPNAIDDEVEMVERRHG